MGAVGEFDGKRYVDVGNVGNFGFYDSFTLSAWINPAAGSGTIVSRANDEAEGKGFGLVLKDGHLSASLVQRWLDDGVRIESEEPVPLNRWSHVSLTYDGSRLASGVRLYLDGRPLRTKVDLDYMNQPFDAKQPLRIGGGLGPENRFRGQIAEVRVYRRALSPEEVAVLAVPEPVSQPRAGAGRPAHSRRRRQSCARVSSSNTRRKTIRAAHKNVLDLREQRERLIDSFPTVMVMQDSATPRETHVLAARRLRPAGRESGARRAGCVAACSPRPAEQPPGVGALAGGSREPADRARGGEPSLADGFRRGAGEDRGRLRLAGRVAVESGIARLAGDGICEQRLEHEGPAEDHRDECDLSDSRRR